MDLVVLAGYMQLLSPASSPAFAEPDRERAPGAAAVVPGPRRVGQALDHGVRVTGVTVHFVDDGVDTGPIILQRPVPVPPDRDRAALEEAIHATEHVLLPEAIRLIAEGRVRVDAANPRLVRIAPDK